MVKTPPAIQEMQEIWVPFLGQEDPLEQGVTTHSSVLALRISWPEEPGGQQTMGSHRVRRDSACTHALYSLSIRLASFLILYHRDTQSNCTLKSPGALKKYQALEWRPGIGVFRMFSRVIKWAAKVESQSINTKSSFLPLDLILVLLSTWSAFEISRSHFRHHLLREDDSDILLRCS